MKSVKIISIITLVMVISLVGFTVYAHVTRKQRPAEEDTEDFPNMKHKDLIIDDEE